MVNQHDKVQPVVFVKQKVNPMKDWFLYHVRLFLFIIIFSLLKLFASCHICLHLKLGKIIIIIIIIIII